MFNIANRMNVTVRNYNGPIASFYREKYALLLVVIAIAKII